MNVVVNQRKNRVRPAEVLVIVCAGVVLASLDLFIVNVALPKISTDLHASSLGEVSWVLNAYAIVYAALLVFFGRLADRYRRDRGFLLGIAIFTLASIGCAASVDVGMLIGFRVVQAAGAALLTPTSLGLLLESYAPDRRSGAVRTWTASGGVAAALGPVIGGLLVTVDWRWVFIVNVPIGIVAMVVGWRRLPAVPGRGVERPDAIGVLLATFGIAALTLGLVEGGDWGWSSGRVVGALVAAAVLLVSFVLHCLRSRTPLIDPSLFTSRNFSAASVVSLLFSAAFGAMLISRVLWQQDVWGWSALRSGLAVAPGPLMVPLVSFGIAGRLIARYGPGRTIAVGSLFFAGGAAYWALAVSIHPNYWTGVFGGMLMTGVGVGLTLPTMMSTAASSLPPASFATGSAVVNMLRQTGMALGVAVVIAIVGGAHGGAVLGAFRDAWWATAAVALLGAVPTLAIWRRPAPSPLASAASSRAIPVGSDRRR